MNSAWTTLGIEPGATPSEIKAAYRKLAMRYHPDRTADAGAEEKFKDITTAYTALMQGVDIEVNEPWPRYTGTRAYKGRYPELLVTLEDAYSGAEYMYKGTKVTLVPGIHCGSLVDISGHTVRIVVESHRQFKRAGDDLLTVVDVNAIQAILGCQLTLVHLDNSVLQYTVPAGIQHGQVVRLCAKGMPDPRTGKYGDLLIQAHIVIPTVLSEIQRAGLDKLFSRPKDVDSNEQKS